jgi:hypothetical protein
MRAIGGASTPSGANTVHPGWAGPHGLVAAEVADDTLGRHECSGQMPFAPLVDPQRCPQIGVLRHETVRDRGLTDK